MLPIAGDEQISSVLAVDDFRDDEYLVLLTQVSGWFPPPPPLLCRVLPVKTDEANSGRVELFCFFSLLSSVQSRRVLCKCLLRLSTSVANKALPCHRLTLPLFTSLFSFSLPLSAFSMLFRKDSSSELPWRPSSPRLVGVWSSSAWERATPFAGSRGERRKG